MPCASLNDLPPAPPGRIGWPWTQQTAQAPEKMPDSLPWPRVTIVTPSFNQGQFLEETIRSVLLQAYPNLEYMVLDGASTDNSVEIIRKYGPWISFWTSERDNGQADAVQRGWRTGTGTVLAYLNSDDTYLPDAIRRAVYALSQQPRAAAICGGELWIDPNGMVISERYTKSATLNDLLHLRFIPQPAIFLRRSAFEQAGGLNTKYHCSFDYELWTRVVNYGEIACIPEILATTRWHSDAKTMARRPEVIEEIRQIVETVLNSAVGSQFAIKERRVIRSLVSQLAASIYVDNLAQYRWQALTSTLSAIAQWPLILPMFLFIFVRKLRHPRMMLSLPALNPSQTHWSRTDQVSHSLR